MRVSNQHGFKLNGMHTIPAGSFSIGRMTRPKCIGCAMIVSNDRMNTWLEHGSVFANQKVSFVDTAILREIGSA